MTSTQELAQRAADKAARRRPGVVVGVLEQDGSRVYAAAGRQGAPDEHTLFEIGSIRPRERPTTTPSSRSGSARR